VRDNSRLDTQRAREAEAEGEPSERVDPLAPERLDAVTYRLIAMGFVLLTLTITTGALWAQLTWHRWWSWDPKETSALVAWFVYVIYLHGRKVHWPKGLTAWVALIGALSVLFCYAGVNFLGGLHSYGQPTKSVLAGAADTFQGLDAAETLLAKLFLSLYLAGFVASLAAASFSSLVRWRHFVLIGTIPTALGFVFHTAALVQRSVLAGRLPFSSGYEYAACFAWAMVLVFLILERRMKTPLLGAASLPLTLLVLGYGFLWFHDKSVSPLPVALQNLFLLHLHVAIAIIGYAALTLATATAALYLVRSRRRVEGAE